MSENCLELGPELSAYIDGEARSPAAVAEHLTVCSTCRAQEQSLRRVRSVLRVRAADPVPDLGDAILDRVRLDVEQRTRKRGWISQLRVAGLAAAVTFLLLIGTSLPWRGTSDDAASASELIRRVRSAAYSLDGYHAVMDVVETGWHPDVPVRRFEVQVWFDPPERFRLEVADLTVYPNGSWPRNDVTLVAGPRRWSISEPYSCPVAALPGCSIGAGTERRTVIDRSPFDGATILPTDVAVPLETLSESGRFEVLGREEVNGREALRLALSARDAAPFLDAVQTGGSWARFDPGDPVELLLDARSWFPVGLEARGSGHTLTIETVTWSEEVDDGVFAAPDLREGSRSAGWEPSEARSFASLTPSFTAGLEPYRAGTIRDATRVMSFVRGMTWIKVTEGPSLPVPADPGEPVAVGSLTGFYLPGEPGAERKVTIYGRDRSITVSTNLSREPLMEVAASLPLSGLRPLPFDLLSEAEVRNVNGVKLPEWLPEGFRFSSAQATRGPRGRTVTVRYRPSQVAPTGQIVTITSSSRTDRLFPTSMAAVAVSVGPLSGRWLPEQGRLQWVEGNVLRSVSVGDLPLDVALAIAESLR